MAVYSLQNQIMDYAWGSTTAIPALLRRPGDGTPQAELWMGTHPKGESLVVVADGAKVPLTDVVGELPFLFKVLAAEHALSIQVHPTQEQARVGFARDEAAGIPRTAPERQYQDANHKRELLVPLTEMWALAGFRPFQEIQEEMRGLPQSVTGAFVTDPTEAQWQRLLQKLISLTAEEVRQVVRTVSATPQGDSTSPVDRYWWVQELARQFPNDPGAVAPLYMNCLQLQPGQGIYLPPGIVHAYLQGMGVELMANSDNVLRAGCTVKHVDVPELLSVVDIAEEKQRPHIVVGERLSPMLSRWSTPATEFELSHVTATGTMGHKFGAVIVLNVGDQVLCNGTPLFPGESVVITEGAEAPDASIVISGAGVVDLYVASVPGAVVAES